MFKIKLFLISAAVVTGVFGAFASKKKCLCETEQQYYRSGTTYIPLGQYGVDYYCINSAGTCTYYLSDPFNPDSYAPCHTGSFSWIGYKSK
jgi:hypothetical protein